MCRSVSDGLIGLITEIKGRWYQIMTQPWLSVGPALKTLAQRWAKVEQLRPRGSVLMADHYGRIWPCGDPGRTLDMAVSGWPAYLGLIDAPYRTDPGCNHTAREPEGSNRDLRLSATLSLSIVLWDTSPATQTAWCGGFRLSPWLSKGVSGTWRSGRHTLSLPVVRLLSSKTVECHYKEYQVPNRWEKSWFVYYT